MTTSSPMWAFLSIIAPSITQRAPIPNNRPVDIRVGNDATIGDDGLIHLRPINLAGGQKSRVRVNRVEVIKKVVRRNRLGQGEVCFKEGPHRSNVLPVTLKNIGEDFVFIEGGRNDVFTEIVVTVVQCVDL